MIDVIPIIKAKMKEKELSTKDLAQRVEIHYQNLIKILNSKSGMNLNTFLRIADVLEIELFADGKAYPASELKKENSILKEDNENLRTLTQFLKKENEELKAKLGE